MNITIQNSSVIGDSNTPLEKWKLSISALRSPLEIQWVQWNMPSRSPAQTVELEYATERDHKNTSKNTYNTSSQIWTLVSGVTCILLIIMSCSTNGCVSPVRFMVPSSMMKAWTEGNEVWTGGSLWRHNIWGMLWKHKECHKHTISFHFQTTDLLVSSLALFIESNNWNTIQEKFYFRFIL